MSKKISELLKSKLQQESDPSNAAVKHEEEGDFVINFNGIKKEIKIEEHLSKIRECRVVLKDIKVEKIQDHFKVHEDITPKLADKNYNKCNFCGKSYLRKSDLMFHQKKFHSNEIHDLFNCQICDAKFFSKWQFEQHMIRKHINGVKIKKHFECDYDGKIFNTRLNLFHHMRNHQMLVECKICQVKVKNIYAHKYQTHSIRQDVKCKICSKIFKRAINLKSHEKIHNKKFTCEICTRKFRELYQLKTHKKEIHENPRSYECQICSKKFNSKKDLKCHEKTHDKNRPKPFKCQRCDYATHISTRYKSHQKFHKRQDIKIALMKNPIKCDKCSTFCRDKQAFRYHMNSVHPKVLFQCDLCGKYFKVFCKLKMHIKMHQKSNK